MESMIENSIYKSKVPFLTNEEVVEFVEYLRELHTDKRRKRFPLLKENREITSKWASRILNFGLPDWKDEDGNIWKPHSVSPWFHLCHYSKGGLCGLHRDERYLDEKDMRDQFKFLIYLNDIPPEKGGATIIHTDPQIKVSPRKGHVLYYNLDLPHEGEKIETEEKGLIGFRVQYKKV